MRRAWVLLLALGCKKSEPATPVARAVAWLVAQEHDGLWRSRSYTALGSGSCLTPFALYALSHAPDELGPHRARIDRALDRLPLAFDEYPTYSIALTILALKRLRPGSDVSRIEKELRARQFAEENGWSESDAEYGGWDHGYRVPKKDPWLRPDLSVTALACEALGGDAKARRFAERCRAEDGGFFFTPGEKVAFQNKAGPGKAYATATCDAIRVLGGDERGMAWLAKGSDPLPAEWSDALYYYRAYATAKVRPTRELSGALRARQRGDGSWANASALMKEDDPILATGMALIALALCPK